MKHAKRNRFVDDAADLSGTDSGDETEEEDLPTAEDAAFIDDAPAAEEPAPKRVRFSRSERRLCEDDLELLRESRGFTRTPSVPDLPESTTVYADSDESGVDSEDDGFVVADHVERKAETLLRKFVNKSREFAQAVLAWLARLVRLSRAMPA